MQTENIPAAKEYYHYSFPELCHLIGQPAALEKVAMYQQLSNEHAYCKDWVIPNCTLLSTYKSPLPVPVPPLLDTMVSVFYSPITNKTRQKRLSLHGVVNLIRSGMFKHETDKLHTISKSTTGKKQDCPNNIYKRTAFSYATFSGTFTYGNDKGLEKHSGFICIDIDDLGERLQEVRATIIADPAVVVCFISPNGDGLKVLYEMDPAKYSQYDWYKGYCIRLSKDFGLDISTLDQSCKNVSRACFLPHDPNIFVNPHFATT